MKLQLYGLEIYEVAKKYPPFVLDSKEYPQLELEIMAVAHAEDYGDETLLFKLVAVDDEASTS